MRTYILFLISMLMSNGAAGQNNSVSLTGYAVNDLNQPIDNASAKLYEMGDKDRLLDSVAINAGHFSLHYDPTSVELIENKAPTIKLLGQNPYQYSTSMLISGFGSLPILITSRNILGEVTGSFKIEQGSISQVIQLSGGTGIQFLTAESGDARLSLKLLGLGRSARVQIVSNESSVCMSLKNTQNIRYKLIISGHDINTFLDDDIQPDGSYNYSNESSPTHVARRPELFIRAVRLEDLKDREGRNVPVDSISGIPGLRVFLKQQYHAGIEINTICSITDNNGGATLKPDLFGINDVYQIPDTLIITNPSDRDTTFYNFVKPIILKPGPQNIHRHLWNQQGNEPIPMITRYTDENGRDMIEYLERIMMIPIIYDDFPPEKFEHMARRLKEESNGRILWKFYLNRPDQKASWQAPLAWTRLNIVRDTINYLAGKTLIDITEVQSKEESNCYINTWKAEAPGQVIENLYSTENGLLYNTRNGINMGTQGETQTIYKRNMQYVLLQEFGHTLNLTGEHGDFLDMTRADAGERLGRNDPLTPSLLEAKVWITNIYQPLCWRPEEYSRDFIPSIR